MAAVSSTLVDHNSSQRVLKVLTCLSFVEDDALVFIEVVNVQGFLFHFADEVLPFYVLLAVLCHVEVHRELTIVVELRFRHRVKVEFKALELDKKNVGQAFDGTSF